MKDKDILSQEFEDTVAKKFPSSNTERDTKFLGFAGKVIEEMMVDHDKNLVVFDWDLEEQSRLATIIARRAYDLVEHVIEHAPNSVSDADDWDIPDMLDLPEEKL